MQLIKNKKVCMVSVDVEEDPGRTSKPEFLGVKNLNEILNIFAAFNIKATLFVTGQVLETYPNLVKKWSLVHEISCHNYYHIPLYQVSISEREEQLEKFGTLYRDILGDKPKGFRAVQHTIDDDQMRLLEKFGFNYDSSVIPSYPFLKKYVGYKGKAPAKPYHPSHTAYRRKGNMRVLEIPVTPLRFGIPLAGTWLRVFGPKLYRLVLTLGKPDFVSLTLHSWDCIEHHGPCSQNSGPRFLESLSELLHTLTRDYVFVNGFELAGTDKV